MVNKSRSYGGEIWSEVQARDSTGTCGICFSVTFIYVFRIGCLGDVAAHYVTSLNGGAARGTLGNTMMRDCFLSHPLFVLHLLSLPIMPSGNAPMSISERLYYLFLAGEGRGSCTSPEKLSASSLNKYESFGS